MSGYVLAHEAGDAFTIKQLRRRAYRLTELLGLRRVRLYDARSSCFTFLANGVPDHILARWAGHTNAKTTKRWYVKPDVEDLRGAATTWDDLHGGAAEGQDEPRGPSAERLASRMASRIGARWIRSPLAGFGPVAVTLRASGYGQAFYQAFTVWCSSCCWAGFRKVSR